MTMRDVNRTVALSGWIFILLICAAVITPYCFLMIRDGYVEEELAGTAKLCLGFLFGSGAGLIKEVMLKDEA